MSQVADFSAVENSRSRLSSSPFAILGVSIRANAAQIQEAYDDRLFDGADEHVLSAARSRLTVARDRLAEELRFLADLAPTRAREVLGALSEAKDLAATLAMVEELPNLARLNAVGDLLGQSATRKTIAAAWHAQREFDPAAAREAIDQARAASGFRAVSDDAWKSELLRFQDEQADILHAAVVSTSRGAAVLTDTIEETRDTESSDWLRKTLDKVIDRFDRWSEPELVRIEEELDRSIQRVRSESEDVSLLSAIEGQLRAWDEINQPVQLREQAKGLDEPKSRRVFDKVRDLAIWLANDQGQYASAEQLSLALKQTFPELPKAIAQLTEDLEALGELVQHSRTQELLRPLLGAIETAKADLSNLAIQVLRGQFSATGTGIAGQLFREFKTACALSERLSNPELPWVFTRSVALSLNNDADHPEAARRILDVLMPTATGEILVKIVEDLDALKGITLQKEFKEACEASDLERARDLAIALMDADPERRAQYAAVKDTLDTRIAQRGRSRWFWGILGAVVGISFLTDQCSSNSTTSYTPSPTTSYEESGAADLEAAENAADAALDAAGEAAEDPGEEVAPPLYNFGTLTLPQLRYCRFEKRRLEILEPQTPPSAYGAFNARVDDFNSRCGQGRYSSADGAAIDIEVAARQAQLSAEANEILNGWTPRDESSPVIPPPVPDRSEDSIDNDPLVPEADDPIASEENEF
jgi:hypothetical protein